MRDADGCSVHQLCDLHVQLRGILAARWSTGRNARRSWKSRWRTYKHPLHFAVSRQAASQRGSWRQLPEVSSMWRSFCSSTFLSRVSVLTRDIDIAILSVCLSVHLSVRPSVRQFPVLYRNSLINYQLLHHTVAQFLWVSNIFAKFRRLRPPAWALNTGVVLKIRDFWPTTCYISQMIRDSAIVTMER